MPTWHLFHQSGETGWMPATPPPPPPSNSLFKIPLVGSHGNWSAENGDIDDGKSVSVHVSTAMFDRSSPQQQVVACLLLQYKWCNDKFEYKFSASGTRRAVICLLSSNGWRIRNGPCYSLWYQISIQWPEKTLTLVLSLLHLISPRLPTVRSSLLQAYSIQT